MPILHTLRRLWTVRDGVLSLDDGVLSLDSLSLDGRRAVTPVRQAFPRTVVTT